MDTFNVKTQDLGEQQQHLKNIFYVVWHKKNPDNDNVNKEQKPRTDLQPQR